MTESVSTANNLLIGEGVTFTGSIEAPGKVSINGKVSGDLKADDVWVGPQGSLRGQIEARVIDVHGELFEDITSKERMSIRHTGQVTGVLQYAELEIERGGRFQGDMKQV
jgi:cytoskeletal protein CcmA (bactofilin family)